MADIPNPGQLISRSQPICTFFARAQSEDECLAKLVRRAGNFEERLCERAPGASRDQSSVPDDVHF
jgi:predicted ATP-grasp superfamily ATP-dependent carboligase